METNKNAFLDLITFGGFVGMALLSLLVCAEKNFLLSLPGNVRILIMGSNLISLVH